LMDGFLHWYSSQTKMQAGGLIASGLVSTAGKGQ
jgi:hypothetical protein